MDINPTQELNLQQSESGNKQSVPVDGSLFTALFNQQVILTGSEHSGIPQNLGVENTEIIPEQLVESSVNKTELLDAITEIPNQIHSKPDMDLTKVFQNFNGILKDGTQINLWIEPQSETAIPSVNQEERNLNIENEATLISEFPDLEWEERVLTEPITLKSGQVLGKDQKVILLDMPTHHQKDHQLMLIPSEFLDLEADVLQVESKQIETTMPVSLESMLTILELKNKQEMLIEPVIVPLEKTINTGFSSESQAVPSVMSKEASMTSQRLTQQVFQKENVPKISREVTEVLSHIKDGETLTTRLTLKPESLGKIEVVLHKQENAVQAKFIVGSEQVKELVEKSLPLFEQNLGKQQISLNKVEVVTPQVATSDFNFSGQFSQEQHQTFQQFKSLRKEASQRQYQVEQEIDEKKSDVLASRVDITV